MDSNHSQQVDNTITNSTNLELPPNDDDDVPNGVQQTLDDENKTQTVSTTDTVNGQTTPMDTAKTETTVLHL